MKSNVRGKFYYEKPEIKIPFKNLPHALQQTENIRIVNQVKSLTEKRLDLNFER